MFAEIFSGQSETELHILSADRLTDMIITEIVDENLLNWKTYAIFLMF